MQVKPLTSILVLFAAVATGFGSPPSGEKLLGELHRVMSDYDRKIQAEGGVSSSRMALHLIRSRAQEAVSDLNPDRVPVQDLGNWGMIAVYAENYPLASRLFLRHIEEAPAGTDLFMSQMFLFGTAVMSKDAKAVVVALRHFRPNGLEQVMSSMHYLLNDVVDFLNSEREFGIARSLIDRWETLLLSAQVVHDHSIERRLEPTELPDSNWKGKVIEARARVLIAEGKVDQARDMLRSEGENPANDQIIRESLLQGIRLLDIIGTSPPELPIVRQSGDFRNLEDLRGKIVIVHFAPHLDRFSFGRFAEAKAIEEALRPLDVETVIVSTFFERGDSSVFPEERQFEEVLGAVKRAQVDFPVVFTTDQALADWGVSRRFISAVIGKDGRILGFVNDTAFPEDRIRELIELSAK